MGARLNNDGKYWPKVAKGKLHAKGAATNGVWIPYWDAKRQMVIKMRERAAKIEWTGVELLDSGYR